MKTPGQQTQSAQLVQMQTDELGNGILPLGLFAEFLDITKVE